MTEPVAPLDLTDGPTVVAMLALQRAAYAVEAQLLGSDAIPALHEDATALASCGETMLGVHEPDGRLVGAAAYKRVDDVVDIHRLVVHPDTFRRGIASRLLDAVDAAEPDATRATVATGAANAPAIALYERRGFVRTGETTVGDGLRIILLSRTTP